MFFSLHHQNILYHHKFCHRHKWRKVDNNDVSSTCLKVNRFGWKKNVKLGGFSLCIRIIFYSHFHKWITIWFSLVHNIRFFSSNPHKTRSFTLLYGCSYHSTFIFFVFLFNPESTQHQMGHRRYKIYIFRIAREHVGVMEEVTVIIHQCFKLFLCWLCSS